MTYKFRYYEAGPGEAPAPEEDMRMKIYSPDKSDRVPAVRSGCGLHPPKPPCTTAVFRDVRWLECPPKFII